MCRRDDCRSSPVPDPPTPTPPNPQPVDPICEEYVCADDCIQGFVHIEGHNDKFYDGNYFYVSHWNCQPHFVNNEGAHLYFFVGVEAARWQLDDRDQSGSHAG